MSVKKSFVIYILMLIVLAFLCAPVAADDSEDPLETPTETPPVNDEQKTFGGVAPDALIVLDLSGSMLRNPPGTSSEYIYGSSTACTPDTVNCVTGASTVNCQNGYCVSSKSGCTINCSRIAIAKRALFNVLDYTNDDVINNEDSLAMGVRIGYMRFKREYGGWGNDTGLKYYEGNIRVIKDISDFTSDDGTAYQNLYCGATGTAGFCDAINISECKDNEQCIGAETVHAWGGTPLVYSLREAKLYLDAHKVADKAKDCRKKFVILVSDGADTFYCGGNTMPVECQEHMYMNRRAQVAYTKALYDAGYRVFVVGFGAGMPGYLQNTLNWMAYYGGTTNPVAENTGDVTAYNIPAGSIFPPGVTECIKETEGCVQVCDESDPPVCEEVCYTATDTCYDGGGADPTAHFRAVENDPGFLPLSGYAFMAADTDELTQALKRAFSTISESSYSFTAASIQAVRTADENFIYEASFTPHDECPFWQGHLKRYQIDQYGNIAVAADWDAGEVLSGMTESDTTKDRNIFTLIESTKTAFTASVDKQYFGVDTDANRNAVVNYIRGGELLADNVTYWRLGDIFHSSPRAIASPNPMFYDQWDLSSPETAYEKHRAANIRSSALGNRIIITGANDGQLHAFDTGTGNEVWSFIPPNQLRRLQLIVHSSHPTKLVRQYFVDGQTSAAEIWIKSDSTETEINATTKVYDETTKEWETIMVSAQGRGAITTLWSSSTHCDLDFSPNYSTTYKHYCGIYAFDVTDTESDPVYKWRIGGTAGVGANGKYLAQPWGRMFIGRVRIDNIEKWVGFISGGYSGTGKVKKNDSKTHAGKGFYVIDLKDGSIIWSFTYDGHTLVSPHKTSSDMDHDLVAAPVAVDSDGDGFLDTAYVGDLYGHIWRFKFCKKSDVSTCDVSNWSGSKLFDASGNIQPIYTSAEVTFDPSYNLWVYVGTGDKTNPTAPNAQELFYAIKDSGDTYTLSDLENLGKSDTSFYDPTADGVAQHGWYIKMDAHEKILAEPVIFQGRVYFTSYIPEIPPKDPCLAPGESFVYNVDYLTGAPQWTDVDKDGNPIKVKSKSLGEGSGVASAVVVSQGPEGGPANIYVSTSVSGEDGGHTGQIIDENIMSNPRGSVIYWQDMRIK